MDRPAVVSIRLTTECWWFVDEARSWPALIPLPGDVQEVLDRMPHMEVSGGVPEPLLVGRMTRPQAEAVQLLAERGVEKQHAQLLARARRPSSVSPSSGPNVRECRRSQ
jgi:hypothetical protein